MENSVNFRTDMADERVDEYKRVNNLTYLDGVEVIQNEKNNITTTVVKITNENGEKSLSKKIGDYITIETKDIKYLEDKEEHELVKIVSDELKNLIKCKEKSNEKSSILIVGLGNEYITPDALGPKVVKNINITRHVLNIAGDIANPNQRSVCAIMPGVLGTTGIETFEIVKSVVDRIKPDIVIAIDSLASSSMHRIGNTIQLSDTGITPGAGVRNKREGLNYESLNVPVIALGVPTVVDFVTLTNEAIDKMIDKTANEIEEFEDVDNDQLKNIVGFLNQKTRYDMVANLLNSDSYIFTPKEVDELIDVTSSIIGKSINLALDVNEF
ncbi:germination protease [Clostridium sp. CAG:1219]|nr:germination protease [Clostridium sp. CAG:1219]